MYQRLIGSLMWLMLATRPDIYYFVGQLARFTSNPTNEHWMAGLRVLRYLQGTKDIGITFNGNLSQKLVEYSDAYWGDDYDDLDLSPATSTHTEGQSPGLQYANGPQPSVA